MHVLRQRRQLCARSTTDGGGGRRRRGRWHRGRNCRCCRTWWVSRFVPMAGDTVLLAVSRGGGPIGAGATRGRRLLLGSGRTRDPGVPGLVPGAVAADPVAAGDTSRDGARPRRCHRRRMPEHVVLGGLEVAGLLRDAGARGVGVVAATDTRPQAVTFVTTLRWLLTGRRDGRMGRAGVGSDELTRVAAAGREYVGELPPDWRIAIRTCSAPARSTGISGRSRGRCGRSGSVRSSTCPTRRWARSSAWSSRRCCRCGWPR